ncbi:MAG: biosynthetic arginine decarboxylase, partial [Candidatus Eisenbacteria bacterium]|nr:biosynthetic arginine decarboxylase [Candidatus Eisenbacteria bacterium]
MADTRPWTIKNALELYNTPGWGAGYFGINDQGRVTVKAAKTAEPLDLYDLTMDLHSQGIGLPLLLRFSDILKARIASLNSRFEAAIKEFNYKNQYTTVYPIKVNQQSHVVEEILEFGREFGVGLETGSKPELLAVLALSTESDHMIVCNGYKDEEYLRLALMGQKLGHEVFMVLEMEQELELLFKVAEEIGVEPTVGIRVKLASTGTGRWADSSGEKSKFGLNPAQIVRVVDRLRSQGKLHWLKLLHFHIGSQVPDIRTIKAALGEVARFYSELRNLGVDITHVDVGGGLAVDYEGSRTTRSSSANYALSEYANDIVYTLAEVCEEKDLPMPHIMSESGRALTAHHALLLVNVIGVETQKVSPRILVNPDQDHQVLTLLAESLQDVTSRSVREVYHDALFAKERARELFNSDVLNIRDVARAEQLYLQILAAISKIAEKGAHEDILHEIKTELTDRYFCNFSVFQSLPDSWAIDQLFPIMPIHRLNERPTRRAHLQDVTCDSDGKIETYVGGRRKKDRIDLHPLKPGEPYVLGIFLTGAYQEILGDLHNLFGDTNAVHVHLKNGGYELGDVVRGDTVTDVLEYVEFKPQNLIKKFRKKVAKAELLTRVERNTFIAEYIEGLDGYTYLEGDETHAVMHEDSE